MRLLINPEDGLGTAKLFIGMVRYDITVNIKGGATVTTVNSDFKLLQL